MITQFKTEQELSWAGAFGNEYTDRNANDGLISNNVALFTKIFSRMDPVSSVMEFGANRGFAVRALKILKPSLNISALEINGTAVQELKKIDDITVYDSSLLDFKVDYQRDFVLTKAVLIHINPNYINQAYDIIYHTAKRYICLMEFYNPTPIDVVYRGQKQRLFKRDFAGDMLDTYKNLRLVDYGFFYHRDQQFPQGDLHWFLLEKIS